MARELTAAEVYEVFEKDFLNLKEPYELLNFRSETIDESDNGIMALGEVRCGEEKRRIRGTGNGPIQAFVNAMREVFGEKFDFLDYHEHALGTGARARAIAYVQ